jgi:hypothetical protein
VLTPTLRSVLLAPRRTSPHRLSLFDKSALAVVNVDGTNLTTSTATTVASVRTNLPIARGRWYWEVQADSVNAAIGGCGIGIANLTQGLTSPSQIGDSLNSICWFDSGAVYRNNAPVTTIQTQVNGQRLRLAYDNLTPGSERIWFDRNGAPANNTWINGAGDPTDLATGFFCDTLNAGPYYPAASVYTSGNGYTVKFNAIDWLYAPPRGFQQLV